MKNLSQTSIREITLYGFGIRARRPQAIRVSDETILECGVRSANSQRALSRSEEGKSRHGLCEPTNLSRQGVYRYGSSSSASVGTVCSAARSVETGRSQMPQSTMRPYRPSLRKNATRKCFTERQSASTQRESNSLSLRARVHAREHDSQRSCSSTVLSRVSQREAA